MAVHAPPEIEVQYRMLREGAGLIDRSSRGKIDLFGPEAAAYLQGQVTNDVEALAPGHGCYAALLNHKGRILADMRVLLRGPGEIWLDTEPSAVDTLRSKLDMYKVGRDVELADRTSERAIVSLIGPRARAVAGVDLPSEEDAFVEAVINGAAAIVVATQDGVDVIIDASSAQDVTSMLLERGAERVSEEACEILRIERGRPRFGHDMSEENFPGELGLEERAVSFTKGCYVGQEPVARMHYRGHPNRHLRGLLLSAPAAPAELISREGKEQGRITSTCVSPSIGPIALALVRREVEPGEAVTVEPADARAEVVRLPFEVA
jgi:folate-binding protein YgfZ